ncbi:MAG TPA: PQQ-dependent dehydrogenase, methanol/ethanol family, partial [Methylibium sp.]
MRLKMLSLLVLMSCASIATQAGVTDQTIENGAKTGSGVLSWGLSTNGERYSPLKQVNAGNASRLSPVWAFSFGGEKQRGQESQPLVYNGKMFVTASYSR